MSIKKLICSGCGSVVGAEDTTTGEHEYVGGYRFYDNKDWCRDCYNRGVLDKTPFMGGIDGLEIEE